MDAGDLQNLQVIFRNSRQVVWIHNADSMGHVNPELGLVGGVCRALNFEQPTLKLYTFDVGQIGLSRETRVNLSHIVDKMRARHSDREYCQKDGVLHVPRIVPVPDMNAQFQDVDHGRTRISLEDAQRCYLNIKTPGMFQTLAFHASAEVPVLDCDFVEVQLKATSINAKVKPLLAPAPDDCLQLAGLLRTTRTGQHARRHLLTGL